MTRLMVVAAALLACAACVTVASLGAGHLGPWLHSYASARWFLPACNLFLAGCFVVASLRRKKAMEEEDERQTPVVRRDPKTGLRQL